MCCLFGVLDYGNNFTGRQKAKLLHVLSSECEARGTDATGIAYMEGHHLRIFKRPLPAHKLRYRIPNGAKAIMGHTRMTTQGSEKRNYNNHPFYGNAGGHRFALAHNGVLYNDYSLRKSLRLPATEIETDSYVAVQLIEQKKSLSFDSLKYMAEQVEGSFMFTVLGEDGSVCFVKEDNPICLIHFPKSGFYLYASTDQILMKALRRMSLPCEKPVQVNMNGGDILKIDPQGKQSWSKFEFSDSYAAWGMPYHYAVPKVTATVDTKSHLDELKTVAGAFGYSPETIDRLFYRHRLRPEEIEEFLYNGEI